MGEEGDCTGWDQHPGRLEKRETVLAGTDIPGGGGRGRLYWPGPTSREVAEEGDCTGGDRHPRRWGERETVLAGTDIPGGGGRGRPYLTLHCRHQNDSCSEMGSDESF